MARRFVLSQAQQVGSDDELSGDDDEGLIQLDDSFIDDATIYDDSSDVQVVNSSFVEAVSEVLPDFNSDDDDGDDGEEPGVGEDSNMLSGGNNGPTADSGIGRSVISSGSSREQSPTRYAGRSVQTTPSLLNAITSNEESPLSQSSEDATMCTVCYSPWTNSGDHRLISLKCGHLFGKSCILRWFSTSAQRPKCPQCNTKSKESDIRPIYVRKIQALDITERETASRELENERELRLAAEKKAASMAVKLKKIETECESLKRKIMEQPATFKKPCIGANNLPSNLPDKRCSKFVLGKSLEVNKNGSCRVMDFSSIMGIIAISQPSPNQQLFHGNFGVRLVNTETLQLNEYIPIHQGLIKDIAFKPNDAILLTAALDKTLKLTSLVSKSVVATIDLEGLDAWSCCWNTEQTNSCYVGLKNGIVREFDTRMTNGQVNSFGDYNSMAVTSISFVPSNSSPYCQALTGLFCNALTSAYFYEFNGPDTGAALRHSLPFEGKFLPGYYDATSGYGLVGTRPSPKNNRLTHTLVDFVKSEDESVSVNIVRSYQGSSQSAQLSKSKIVSDPTSLERNVIVFSNDEREKGTVIWESHTGKHLQTLKQSDPVLDIQILDRTDDRISVALLTEKKISFYERKMSS